MKKLTELLKLHPTLAGDLLKLAPICCGDARKDSYDKLRQLCRGEQPIMVQGISGAVLVQKEKYQYQNASEGIKKFKKNARRLFLREVMTFRMAIRRVRRLDESINEDALMDKAYEVSKKRFYTALDLPYKMEKARENYHAILSTLIDFILSNTNHSKDAAYTHLAAFLNSLGHTTLTGKRFTRQNIRKIHIG